MTISIISTTSAPTRAKVADADASSASQDSDAFAGSDFASLLFGRLGTAASKDDVEDKNKKTSKETLRNEEEKGSALNNSIDVLLAPIIAAADEQFNTSASAAVASSVIASPIVTVASDARVEDEDAASITALDLTAKSSTSLKEAPNTPLSNDSSATAASFSLPVSANTTESPVATASTNGNANKSAKIAVDLMPDAKPAMRNEATEVVVKEGNANTLISTTVTTQGSHVTARQEVTMTVPTPLRDSGWSNDFGQKIVWMTRNDAQSAKITLNPPHMGPVEVSLNIDKGNASATFVSAHADVRETLEAALPRLREMLAGVGVSLGEANVNAQSSQHNQNASEDRRPPSQAAMDKAILAGESDGANVAHTILGTQDQGLVDLFA